MSAYPMTYREKLEEADRVAGDLTALLMDLADEAEGQPKADLMFGAARTAALRGQIGAIRARTPPF